MKRIIAISLFFFLSISWNVVVGQANVVRIGKITGKVVDAGTGSPLEYATVAIFNAKDSSLVTGTITEPNGNFKISEVPVGDFYLRIDFMGYKTLIKGDVAIGFDNREVNLKKLLLEPQQSTLEAVNIVAERPLYQNQIDRKIINPEQDIMASGGSALNVLENAPSVDVDIDGNVALRGNTSVTILIDGRPSGYSGESAGDLLNQIPANAIDKIEVITNPSSKYDPEGVTGIINIVMKKNSVRGFNGTVNAGIGTQLDYNGGGNINFRNNWMSLYSNLGVSGRKRESEGNNYKETYFTDTMVFNQDSKGKNKGMNLNARLGIDFFVNKSNTFSITGRVSGSPVGTRNQINKYENYRLSTPDVYTNRYKTEIVDDNTRFSYNVGALWEKKFSKKDHTLLFDASFGKRNNNETSGYWQYDYIPKGYETGDTLVYTYGKQDITKGSTQDFEGKIDYALPVAKSSKFEAGGSVRMRKMDNRLDKERDVAGDFVPIPESSNQYIYDESIYALYAQFGSKLGNFSYQVGLRGEYVDMEGTNSGAGELADFQSDYFQFYPTAYVMYQLKEFNEFKLNYTRRVNRPGPWNLNPFQNVTDSMNIQIGNPSLKPEYINAVELSFFRYLKNGSVSATVFYRNTTDVISRVTEIDTLTNATISTWENLNTTNSYGLDLTANGKLFKIWSLTASGNIGYSSIDGTLDGQSVSNSGINWSLRMNNSFLLTETTTLQFNMRYNGPRITAQGKFNGFFMSDIGLRQDFLKKTLSLTLRVNDVFNTMKFSSYSEGDNFYQETWRKPKSLTGYLTLTWKFGNMQIREQRRQRTSGDNGDYEGDDMMDMY